MGNGSKTKLYFRDGKSDKVYEAQVVPAQGGYVVNFAYGRRGSTLKTGTKTPNPVKREHADSILHKLVQEKKAKGYREIGDPPQAEPNAKISKTDSANAVLTEAVRQFEREAARHLASYRSRITDLSLILSARDDQKRHIKLEWRSIIDPALGTLTFDGGTSWTTQRSVAGFADNMKIKLDVPNHYERRKSKDTIPPLPPNANQRNAFRKFIIDPMHFRAILEKANWDFYRREIFEGEDEGHPRAIAHFTDRAEVWKLLSDPSIVIPIQKGAGWWIQFLWECRWDREHGHKVILRNGKLNYIGQQGGAD